MKLNHLRNVVAVGERGSVHAAARHLRITQPVLTRSIRELERELGVPLFDRGARGVVVTEMGQRFIQRARAVLSELDHARAEIDQLNGSMQGRISMCLGVMPHFTLLPHALKAFRARYPDVELDIDEARFPSVEASLRAGIVDFFVGPQHVPLAKEFIVEKLYEQEVAVFCRKGHPLAKARSLRELVGAEWLCNAVTADPKDEITPLFAKYGLPAPRLVLRAHSGITGFVAVASSDLLKLVPAEMEDTVVGAPHLVRINVAEEIPRGPIALIRRAGLPLTPAAEYFVDMVRRASVQHARGLARRERRRTAVPMLPPIAAGERRRLSGA